LHKLKHRWDVSISFYAHKNHQQKEQWARCVSKWLKWTNVCVSKCQILLATVPLKQAYPRKIIEITQLFIVVVFFVCVFVVGASQACRSMLIVEFVWPLSVFFTSFCIKNEIKKFVYQQLLQRAPHFFCQACPCLITCPQGFLFAHLHDS
jgi:hypothetical protein